MANEKCPTCGQNLPIIPAYPGPEVAEQLMSYPLPAPAKWKLPDDWRELIKKARIPDAS